MKGERSPRDVLKALRQQGFSVEIDAESGVLHMGDLKRDAWGKQRPTPVYAIEAWDLIIEAIEDEPGLIKEIFGR